jgi:hypothetical protein
VQQVYKHAFAFRGTYDLGFGKQFKYNGYATGMVLFSVITDDIIQLLNIQAIKVVEQDIIHGGVNRVYQGRFLTALHHVRVVARSIRRWYQSIE